MPQQYLNQDSVNHFNFIRWFNEMNLVQNPEFTVGSGSTFTSWTNSTGSGGTIEEAKVSNFVTHSQSLNNAAWTKANVTIQANSHVSYNGTLTADTITEDAVNSSFHVDSATATVVNGATYNLSAYAKMNGRRYVLLYEGFTDIGVFFDLQTGTALGSLGAGVLVNSAITLDENGYYLISISYVQSGTSASLQMYLSSNGTGVAYIGDGTSGIIVSDPQIGRGAIPTTRIITTTTAITLDNGINNTRATQLNSNGGTGVAKVSETVVSIGQTYDVSVWAKKVLTTNNTYLDVSDGSGSATYASTLLTTEFQEFTYRIVATSTTVAFGIYGSVSGNSNLVVDNVSVNLVQSGSNLGITNPYIKDADRIYMPVIAKENGFRFYINFDTAITSPSFANVILRLYNQFGVSVFEWNNTFLNSITVGAGYHIYSDLLDLSAFTISNGTYYLGLVNSTTGNVIYSSNWLEYYSANFEGVTSKVSYAHLKNIFNFKYESILSVIPNVFRLHVFEKEIVYSGESEQYREVTTGTLRNLASDADRIINMETYFFDREAHEAMDAFTYHSLITINSKEYIRKGGYSANTVNTSRESKGEVEMVDQAYSRVNK